MSRLKRTEKDMVENTPVKLFRVGGKEISVRLRPAALIDAWLEQGDNILTVWNDVSFLQKQHTLLYMQWLMQKAQHETQGKMPSDPLYKELQEAIPIELPEMPEGEKPASEQEVQEAYERYIEVRKKTRAKMREFLNALAECICDYDPDAIPRTTVMGEATDEQLISAFLALRSLSDPLVIQQRCTVDSLGELANKTA